MSRREKITVAEWLQQLTQQELDQLKNLERVGFSTIEATPIVNYCGRLPRWHLPHDVAMEMSEANLDLKGLSINLTSKSTK